MPIVSLLDSNKTFDVNDGETLYDSLSDRGEELPHGCLSGSCGACRVEIVKGHENLQMPGVIEKDTLKSLREEFKQTHGDEFGSNTEIRLACRAKVLGDVAVKTIK
jgi:ferredoxin